MRYIDDELFSSCENLEMVEAPGVELIYGTFKGCKNLKTVLLPNLRDVGGKLNTFLDCENLELFYAPKLKEFSSVFYSSRKDLTVQIGLNDNGEPNYELTRNLMAHFARRGQIQFLNDNGEVVTSITKEKFNEIEDDYYREKQKMELAIEGKMRKRIMKTIEGNKFSKPKSNDEADGGQAGD